MTDKPEHLRAQAALVRMIYDPAFAAAVHADARVLPSLSPTMRDELAQIDPRALRRDEHRRERTLGQLCEELPCTVTLLLAEGVAMAQLVDFYASAEFHHAIDEDLSLVLSFATYLQALVRSPATAALLTLEAASARARRDRDAPPIAGLLRRAAGVEPIEVPRGALSLLHAVERHRFRLGLLPWAQAIDPPRPSLPPLESTKATLAAIALGDDVTLVELERPLWAVLYALAAPRTRAAVIDEATLRIGDRAAANAALDELVRDELVDDPERNPERVP